MSKPYRWIIQQILSLEELRALAVRYDIRIHSVEDFTIVGMYKVEWSKEED